MHHYCRGLPWEVTSQSPLSVWVIVDPALAVGALNHAHSWLLAHSSQGAPTLHGPAWLKAGAGSAWLLATGPSSHGLCAWLLLAIFQQGSWDALWLRKAAHALVVWWAQPALGACSFYGPSAHWPVGTPCGAVGGTWAGSHR